ncbi:MAG: histidine kinase [Polaribacter sp.]|uniref:sensor histidine kinase n=1 Tax=Polaribacter sp. TaxID=1920175 RepID=UPI002F35510B
MKNTFKNINYKIPIKYHLIFWISYFILNVVRWGSYYEDYWYSFKSNIVTVTLGMLLAYFHVYFLLPKLLFKKKTISYVLFFLIALIVFYIVRTELIFIFINDNVWPESQTPQRAYAFNHILVVCLIGIYDVGLATTLKLTTDWIFDRKRIETLQATQLKTELQFLKAQIQPHFFFNTLNNLYALTLENSKQAPEVVLKLSEIMEYILYRAKEPKIRLLNEINYVQNYIDLERLRYGKKVHVEINMIGNIEGQNIPPLLFLPFIENCFKHGTVDNNKLNVLIEFEVTEENLLKFTVKNNYNLFSQNTKDHGIGNQNVLRRLELLYMDKFTLNTRTEKQNYIVELTIQL